MNRAPRHRLAATRGSRRAASGMTLLEVVIASSITVMVLGMVMAGILLVMREERNALAVESVVAHAQMVEERVQRLLRSFSRDQGLAYGQTVGSWSRLLVGRVGSGAPQQSLRFTDGQLVHDPNVDLSGDERPIGGTGARGASYAQLDTLGFRPSLKEDGSVDGGMVLVTLEVSDGGRAKRPGSDPDDPDTWIRTVRSFAVQLRNF